MSDDAESVWALRPADETSGTDACGSFTTASRYPSRAAAHGGAAGKTAKTIAAANERTTKLAAKRKKNVRRFTQRRNASTGGTTKCSLRNCSAALSYQWPPPCQKRDCNHSAGTVPKTARSRRSCGSENGGGG